MLTQRGEGQQVHKSPRLELQAQVLRAYVGGRTADNARSAMAEGPPSSRSHFPEVVLLNQTMGKRER